MHWLKFIFYGVVTYAINDDITFDEAPGEDDQGSLEYTRCMYYTLSDTVVG